MRNELSGRYVCVGIEKVSRGRVRRVGLVGKEEVGERWLVGMGCVVK